MSAEARLSALVDVNSWITENQIMTPNRALSSVAMRDNDRTVEELDEVDEILADMTYWIELERAMQMLETY